jgi:hypothetical protein
MPCPRCDVSVAASQATRRNQSSSDKGGMHFLRLHLESTKVKQIDWPLVVMEFFEGTVLGGRLGRTLWRSATGSWSRWFSATRWKTMKDLRWITAGYGRSEEQRVCMAAYDSS